MCTVRPLGMITMLLGSMMLCLLTGTAAAQSSFESPFESGYSFSSSFDRSGHTSYTPESNFGGTNPITRSNNDEYERRSSWSGASTSHNGTSENNSGPQDCPEASPGYGEIPPNCGQGQGGSTQGQGEPDPIPVDGGLSLLLLAGAGYGAHRMRKDIDNDEEEK